LHPGQVIESLELGAVTARGECISYHVAPPSTWVASEGDVMCGVFGYVGQQRDVGETVLAALKMLEYRGYDSWGLAVSSPDGLLLDKDVGRINGHVPMYPPACLAIGHTRWATHGGVTKANAHPHLDCTRRIAVVHNGIIENHAALRAELETRGHHFASETDSEVVAHLMEERRANGQDLASALADVFALLEGYNAIVVLDAEAGQFAATKHVSPLVVGLGEHGSTVASDAIALHDHADRLLYLEDGQLAILGPDGVDLFHRTTLRPILASTVALPSSGHESGHAGYPDFMSKEMAEQPGTLRRLVDKGRDEIDALAAAISEASDVLLVGCGTAGNAALAGTYLFDEICGRPVTAVPASEFRYRSRSLRPNTLVIALSQSGETVDVLEAMTEAANRGARLAAIVNSPHSSLDRMVTTRVRLDAGVEQCVLATKSFTAKLAVLLLTACAIEGRWDQGAEAVIQAASTIEYLMNNGLREQSSRIAAEHGASEHLFVIGRGIHYPSALEAALKIKEVSYIHAEGFAAGELKHGVIALVAPGVPCLVLAPEDDTRTDIISGASELRSRGAHIIGIGNSIDPIFDDFIAVPDTGLGNFITEAVPGQFLAYAAAMARGNDPDRPRNLAKSVTVK
jgi:glucosamine--fructose-6-phosphate aminotransferase (isomerizing)